MSLRFGAVLPDIVIPYTYTKLQSLPISQSTGIFFACLGVICTLIFNSIDKHNETMLRKKQLNETSYNATREISQVGKSTIIQMEEEEITLQSFKQLKSTFWIFSILIVLMYGTF